MNVKSSSLHVMGCVPSRNSDRRKEEFPLMSYLVSHMSIKSNDSGEPQEEKTALEMEATNETLIEEKLKSTKEMHSKRVELSSADSEKEKSSVLDRLHHMEWKRNQQDHYSILSNRSKQRSEPVQVRFLPQKSDVESEYFSGTGGKKSKAKKKSKKTVATISLEELGVREISKAAVPRPRVYHPPPPPPPAVNAWTQKSGAELFLGVSTHKLTVYGSSGNDDADLKRAIEESLLTAQEEQDRFVYVNEVDSAKEHQWDSVPSSQYSAEPPPTVEKVSWNEESRRRDTLERGDGPWVEAVCDHVPQQQDTSRKHMDSSAQRRGGHNETWNENNFTKQTLRISKSDNFCRQGDSQQQLQTSDYSEGKNNDKKKSWNKLELKETLQVSTRKNYPSRQESRTKRYSEGRNKDHGHENPDFKETFHGYKREKYVSRQESRTRNYSEDRTHNEAEENWNEDDGLKDTSQLSMQVNYSSGQQSLTENYSDDVTKDEQEEVWDSNDSKETSRVSARENDSSFQSNTKRRQYLESKIKNEGKNWNKHSETVLTVSTVLEGDNAFIHPSNTRQQEKMENHFNLCTKDESRYGNINENIPPTETAKEDTNMASSKPRLSDKVMKYLQKINNCEDMDENYGIEQTTSKHSEEKSVTHQINAQQKGLMMSHFSGMTKSKGQDETWDLEVSKKHNERFKDSSVVREEYSEHDMNNNESKSTNMSSCPHETDIFGKQQPRATEYTEQQNRTHEKVDLVQNGTGSLLKSAKTEEETKEHPPENLLNFESVSKQESYGASPIPTKVPSIEEKVVVLSSFDEENETKSEGYPALYESTESITKDVAQTNNCGVENPSVMGQPFPNLPVGYGLNSNLLQNNLYAFIPPPFNSGLRMPVHAGFNMAIPDVTYGYPMIPQTIPFPGQMTQNMPQAHAATSTGHANMTQTYVGSFNLPQNTTVKPNMAEAQPSDFNLTENTSVRSNIPQTSAENLPQNTTILPNMPQTSAGNIPPNTAVLPNIPLTSAANMPQSATSHQNVTHAYNAYANLPQNTNFQPNLAQAYSAYLNLAQNPVSHPNVAQSYGAKSNLTQHTSCMYPSLPQGHAANTNLHPCATSNPNMPQTHGASSTLPQNIKSNASLPQGHVLNSNLPQNPILSQDHAFNNTSLPRNTSAGQNVPPNSNNMPPIDLNQALVDIYNAQCLNRVKEDILKLVLSGNMTDPNAIAAASAVLSEMQASGLPSPQAFVQSSPQYSYPGVHLAGTPPNMDSIPPSFMGGGYITSPYSRPLTVDTSTGGVTGEVSSTAASCSTSSRATVGPHSSNPRVPNCAISPQTVQSHSVNFLQMNPSSVMMVPATVPPYMYPQMMLQQQMTALNMQQQQQPQPPQQQQQSPQRRWQEAPPGFNS